MVLIALNLSVVTIFHSILTFVQYLSPWLAELLREDASHS